MPIRISRDLLRPVLAASFLLLVACGPSAGVREHSAPAPADPETLLANGDAALERGELPEAAKAYRLAAEASQDESVAEQATRVAYGNHQLREAQRASDRWLALNPTSEQARRYSGVTALRLHELDKAEAQFADLLGTVYISPAAGFLALLPVISEEGTPADVTELFRRLAARYPKVAEGQYALGSSALRSENFALALSSAEQAAQMSPYWTPAKMLLARTKIAAGHDDEGLALAKDLVTAPESDVSTQLEYALLLASTGRDEEARAMLTPYATGKTVVPGAVRTLGALDLEAGKLDDASRHFEDLLSTGAMSYEALYYLGAVAERRKDADRALRYYSRVAGGEFVLPAQQRVARIKAEQSGLEAGLLHLEEFGRSQPQLGPSLVVSRAGLASSFGDDKRALDILTQGLAQYPDSLEVRMERVFVYERTGKEDVAIRELREMLRERPGDVSVENALGYTLADHGRQLDEAHQLVSAALAQTPDNAAVLDSMGWVLFRQGKHQEALDYLKRAREYGSDPEIDLHIGEAQWALGDQAAARKTWQDALSRHPDNQKLQERLKRAGP